ncbi:magnesium transporter [Emcibacter sp.]|uniref:magnesium transporter n=1 Tax=Emcibacter sp. TaxID=1979954 RepID=UPI002AA94019|nr:magnesium transporter [Emcibacter sp.]
MTEPDFLEDELKKKKKKKKKRKKKKLKQEVLQNSPELVQEVVRALEEDDHERIDDVVDALHSADLADLFEQLTTEDRAALVTHIGGDLDPDVLTELDEVARDHVITEMDDRHVVKAITEMETDDAIHLIEDLDEVDQRRILDALPEDDRIAVEEGLSYPEESAGRLLQKKLIAVPSLWPVGKVIDFLREEDGLPEDFYEIFVVDPLHHPIGTLRLSHLLRASRDVLVSEIMDADPKVVPVDMDQEEVAFLFRQYDLTSMGVVDQSGRLIGMITVDDVVDVMDEEVQEDILRMAGVQDTDILEGVLEASRNRITWLVVNLGTAILASLVISQFDATIQQMVALAILMPIVASLGGNAGNQAMTVAVRSLATRELTSSNAFRVVTRELSIGFLNGCALATIIGVLTALWFQNPALGGVIALAMVVNMIVAGLAGIMVPLTLEKMNIDPALASTVLVTAITDVIGFLAFLGLAALFLV